MSIKDAETITRSDSADAAPAPHLEPHVCDGCRDLTLRVERLEQHLAALPIGNPHKLTTNACYWICVAVHAVLTFMLMSSALMVQVGLVMLLGAIGTATSTHVLSSRPTYKKLPRTMAAFAIVTGSGLLSISMADLVDVTEFVSTLMIYLPVLLGCSWFVAKLFVWTRGWRIVPPGEPDVSAKLQIRQLLFCTLLIAIYLGSVRYFFFEELAEVSASELALSLVYFVVPVSASTLFACLISRILLSPSGHLVRNLCLLGSFLLLLTALVYGIFFAINGGESLGSETVVALMTYGMVALTGILASPAFTYTMMRWANYRMVHPGHTS